MQKFTLNSTNLHYQILGEGKSILFLHGFLEDHSIWDAIYPFFLEKNYQVILVDLPCHGLSRFHGATCSMAEMAMALGHLLEEKRITEPIVFGHSMGGYVGLALLRLQKIKLTLIHSNFWTDSEEKRTDRDRVIEVVKKNKNLFLSESIPNLFASENRKNFDEKIVELIEKSKKIPTKEITAATRGIRDRKPAYDLMNEHSISLIQGATDPIIPTSLLESECKKLKQPPAVYTIENSGHMSFYEKPKELINHLLSVIIK
jgi:pimeloyl-ACP methyl ester carboxylesterase